MLSHVESLNDFFLHFLYLLSPLPQLNFPFSASLCANVNKKWNSRLSLTSLCSSAFATLASTIRPQPPNPSIPPLLPPNTGHNCQKYMTDNQTPIITQMTKKQVNSQNTQISTKYVTKKRSQRVESGGCGELVGCCDFLICFFIQERKSRFVYLLQSSKLKTHVSH